MFARTTNLIIRKLDEQDVELARILHNDKSVLSNLTDEREVDKISQSKWFQKLQISNTSNRYAIYQYDKNLKDQYASESFVGIFREDVFDVHNKSVMIGMDVMPNMRRKGYAKETYDYMLHYYFNCMNLNRVYLFVISTNTNAFDLYKKLGFKEEGVQRQAIYRNNKFIDYIMMSILKSEYE